MAQHTHTDSVSLEQQLEAKIARYEEQANRDRALLAELKQKPTAPYSAQPQPALTSLNTAFHFAPSNTPAHRHHGQPVPPHSASMPTGDLAQSSLYQHQQDSYNTPMKRVKTCQPGLQHSVSGPASSMSRSKSTSYASSNPFTARGSVTPVPVPVSQGHASINRFPSSAQQDLPPNLSLAPSMGSYTFVSPDQNSSTLDPVMEHSHHMTGTLENPDVFLQRFNSGLNVPRNQTTIVPVYQQHPTMHASYQLHSSQDIPSSQCGSLSSGPTFSDGSMTRSSSNANQSALSNQMMDYASQSAFGDNFSSPQFDLGPDQQFPPSNKPNSPSQTGLAMSSSSPPNPFANYTPVPMGRSTSIGSHFHSSHSQQTPRASVNMHRHMSMQGQPMQKSDSHLSTQPFNGAATQRGEPPMRTISTSIDQSARLQNDTTEHSEPMARTDSARSAKSTQSQRERGKEALKRHNTHAQIQPLAPKPQIESTSPTSAQCDTKTGADGKLAMPRASGYQRPKRPKISCDQCDEQPDGFRGEHELRRHKDLKHSKEFKRFVCRTPAQLGLASDLQPISPLEKCKHCTANKEYGQYYNAAAHLRRAHFKEKPPRASRSKSGNANGTEEPRQKRAGMGGGDWPPMSELKAKWMEEIKSTKPANDSITISDDEGHQDMDMDMFNGSMPSYLDAHPVFNDATTSFVGSNTNLQVQNDDVYTDVFNNDLNYTTSPQFADFDPSMMPSSGSANFDFNSPITQTDTMFSPTGHGFYPHDLSADLNVNTQFQSPNNSASTDTLTPFDSSFSQYDIQFAQKSSQQSVLSTQLSPQGMLGDMDFGLAMGVGFEEASLHAS